MSDLVLHIFTGTICERHPLSHHSLADKMFHCVSFRSLVTEQATCRDVQRYPSRDNRIDGRIGIDHCSAL